MLMDQKPNWKDQSADVVSETFSLYQAICIASSMRSHARESDDGRAALAVYWQKAAAARQSALADSLSS